MRVNEVMHNLLYDSLGHFFAILKIMFIMNVDEYDAKWQWFYYY